MTYEDIDASTKSIPGRNHTAMMDQDTRLDNKFDEIARLLIFATNVSEEDDDPIPEAIHLLGIMYEYRLIGMDAFILNGIKKDVSQLKSLFLQDKSNYALAKGLYSRAIELDYVESMYHYHLGLMYAYGRGVQRNSAKAVDLFRRAALEHYHAASMRYLGLFSLNGYGVPQDEIDFEMAKYWFRQYIEWSNDHSAIPNAGASGNNSENWIKQLCISELQETSDLSHKAEQFKNKLRTNLTNTVPLYTAQ